jgi:general nucleoside transport system ATP-binding protein
MSSSPLLELRGVTKRFPGVVANDDISLSLAPGEVLGVLGENGAGKSTLMNILAGLVVPDAGEIFIDGAPTHLTVPRDAVAAGIGMVHQHFKLIGALTVRENLALGDPRWGRRVVDYARLTATIGALARDLGMGFEPAARIDDLSIGQRQQVEILKALARSPRILILDEPTSVLAPEERAGLFAMMARLKERGTGIILISHRLEDILETCDRVTVMRQGRVVGGGAVVGLTRADLVRMVVGNELPTIEHRASASGPLVLVVEGLTLRRPNGSPAVAGASFELRAGEITALCGVDGNGQSELIELIAGMLAPQSGKLIYHLHGEQRPGPLAPARLRSLGVAHVPEDRQRRGVVAAFSLAGNWLLTNLWNAAFAPRGWLRHDQARTRCGEAIRAYDIKARGPADLMRNLSGGNQQKLVLARELADAAELVLAAHATRGLDVRTIAFVLRELLRARDRGACVLLLSSDLDEVWEVADRVMVMSGGHLRGPVPLGATTRQEVGHWMTGTA